MSISIEQKYHGAVFKELFEAISSVSIDIFFRIVPTNVSRSGYVVEVIKPNLEKETLRIGLYIKHCKSRRTPWRFTFKNVHQLEMRKLKDECDEMFLVLIPNDDGIACIDYQMLKEILDENYEETEWVSLTRKPKQSYRIAGKDGKMETTLAKKTFPIIITNFIEQSV